MRDTKRFFDRNLSGKAFFVHAGMNGRLTQSWSFLTFLQNSILTSQLHVYVTLIFVCLPLQVLLSSDSEAAKHHFSKRMFLKGTFCRSDCNTCLEVHFEVEPCPIVLTFFNQGVATRFTWLMMALFHRWLTWVGHAIFGASIYVC